MLWEEKIEYFKKVNAVKDFSVPFTVWSEILKKIEDSFSIAYDARYPLTNWQEKISGLKEITDTDKENLLQSDANYWVVIPDLRPNGHNLVYDCKATLINDFIKLHSGDYYIVDKKYTWLVYYESVINSLFSKTR